MEHHDLANHATKLELQAQLDLVRAQLAKERALFAQALAALSEELDRTAASLAATAERLRAHPALAERLTSESFVAGAHQERLPRETKIKYVQPASEE
jgi:hypothetical protein